MTQDPQGFDKEPEVPDAEAAGPEAPAESSGGSAGKSPGSESSSENANANAAGGGEGNGGHGEAPAGDDTPAGAAHPEPQVPQPPHATEVQQVALTAQLDQARSALNERTQDLQRLQAEFQNYRRRVERDRIAVREMAVANLLTELLPVLDDIGRARDHGELVGGFKQVAESLETVAAKMGLMQFGKEGEPFDPTIHEALMHSYSPDVTETTCVQILQPGYRIGDRTIRPARVGVAEPQPGVQRSESTEGDTSGKGGKGGKGGKPGKSGKGGAGESGEADEEKRQEAAEAETEQPDTKESGGPDKG
ncbi:nucleotide exchange factor GrpE [Streptomyces sp. 6N223]|uniref:nucleotide exchange factor GrpE n=1 Tax=Streptomyces sp. 6N223 TaxID=3457412 RepID=UPI003FCF21B9